MWRPHHIIEARTEAIRKFQSQLTRVKECLARKGCRAAMLTHHVQEIRSELVRRDRASGELMPTDVRRDSHNSGLPTSLDLPGVKSANAVKRTRSLRRKSGKSVGAQEDTGVRRSVKLNFQAGVGERPLR